MSELRDPPAFQWYPAALMSDETWILADLDQRGLFATMMNFCWVNGSLPADHDEQARLLNIPADRLQDAAQCRLISRHFRVTDNRLYAPELERQLRAMHERRERLQKSGSKGGKKTQQRRGNSKRRSSEASSLAQAPQSKTEQDKTNQVLQEGDSSADPWLRDYDSTEERPRHGHALRVDWGSK